MEAPSGINVTALALYNDKIYAGTDKGLVYEIDGRGEVRRLPLGVHDEINVFLVDRGRLLIGTEGYGLVSFDGATDRAERIAPNYTAPYVRSLAVDSQRRLWVGTFTGLYIMDAERKKIVFKDNASSPEGGLSHSSVRRIYIDDNGGIWLGTFFGGLNYYHPSQNQFGGLTVVHADDARRIARRFDKVQSVYDILNASQGKLWLATLDGV